MHLNLFVSQRCFVYCKGCYSYSREEKCGIFLPTKKILKFLKFAYQCGLRKITLCGGDPLTRKDILHLLKRIKKIGFYISLDTLGTSIIKKVKLNNKTIKITNAKKLSKVVDMIGIPIDGANNKVFKSFRPTNNDILNEQLHICDKLHKYGANICINTVINKQNIDNVLEIVNLINGLNFIKKWQIFKYIASGKYGHYNKNLFEISDKDFLEFKNIAKNNFNNQSILEFKDQKVRDKAYMLVDNSGNAWIQSFNKQEELNKRLLLGNILNKEDWRKICLKLIKN